MNHQPATQHAITFTTVPRSQVSRLLFIKWLCPQPLEESTGVNYPWSQSTQAPLLRSLDVFIIASLPHRSRPVTTIFSLPNELLIEIFTKVRTYRPNNKALHPDFASSSSDVAAVGLTCRRFAATSSHHLLHYMRLHSINAQSLHKLEEVSCHPLIGKGVRIIRLELRCFVPNLADDINEFATWAAERVLNMARCHRRALEREGEVVKAGGSAVLKNTMEGASLTPSESSGTRMSTLDFSISLVYHSAWKS